MGKMPIEKLTFCVNEDDPFKDRLVDLINQLGVKWNAISISGPSTVCVRYTTGALVSYYGPTQISRVLCKLLADYPSTL
ncbi:MAG: hypothetical protein KJ955_02295 [Nanoarchaeota archaeon]|nr:hypothetical protein [Nanoarchaeota archaeon]